MAEVYLAHDRHLDRPVALKVLSSELSRDPSFVERFRREAQAAADLSHPNIVAIYDWGQEHGTYFIVMEYIDGHPLRDVLRDEGARSRRRPVADIGAEVAAALSFAHKDGVVHRDVKPGNVLIDHRRPGEGHRLRDRPRWRPNDGAHPDRRRSWAPPPTSRPSRRRASRSTAAPTSTRSASCSTRWRRACRRSPARTPCRSRTSTCAKTVAPPSKRVPAIPPELEQVILDLPREGPEPPLPVGRRPARRPDAVPARPGRRGHGRSPPRSPTVPDDDRDRSRHAGPPTAGHPGLDEHHRHAEEAPGPGHRRDRAARRCSSAVIGFLLVTQLGNDGAARHRGGRATSSASPPARPARCSRPGLRRARRSEARTTSMPTGARRPPGPVGRHEVDKGETCCSP